MTMRSLTPRWTSSLLQDVLDATSSIVNTTLLYLGSTFYTNLLYLEAKLPGITRWSCSLRDATFGRKKPKRKWFCGEVEEGATSCPKMIVVCVDYSKSCHLWAKHGLEDVQCYLLVVVLVGSLPVAVWDLWLWNVHSEQKDWFVIS